ncbi:MAG: Asp-tRNA(Asn)/Glu-tRNA(Gln) amidotransferase subunit GatC [Candidatus Kapabacteria bacterium]|nr:Asp-tRNA(Asn)/Glu-tRNA(Gln) amidotransferase subunit GatC [Candidatus Kapabacteria bacterium]
MTIEEIHSIASLARLRFTDEQAAAYARQFTDIVAFVDVLKSVDMSEVEPMTSVNHQVNVLRDDVTGESIPTADALRNAPKKNEAFIKVPKVLG